MPERDDEGMGRTEAGPEGRVASGHSTEDTRRGRGRKGRRAEAKGNSKGRLLRVGLIVAGSAVVVAVVLVLSSMVVHVPGAAPKEYSIDVELPRDEGQNPVPLARGAAAPGSARAVTTDTIIAMEVAEAPAEEADREAGGEGGLLVTNRLAAPAKKAGKPAAPVKTWKRAEASPNASRLMVGDKEDLPLKGMQANVRIDGFRARVVLDLFYFNDKGRQFEGTFKLRLPNEASPFMFAFGESVLVAGGPPDEPRFILDEEGLESLTVEEVMRSRAETWENVKEARMVPKEKAAFAYTETVRRRIDPALMEWSGAGIFSARVFPLRPKKLHRIVIGYDVDLLQAGDDLVYTLDLPSAKMRRVVDIDLAEAQGRRGRGDRRRRGSEGRRPHSLPLRGPGRADDHRPPEEPRHDHARGERPQDGELLRHALPAGAAEGGGEGQLVPCGLPG